MDGTIKNHRKVEAGDAGGPSHENKIPPAAREVVAAMGFARPWLSGWLLVLCVAAAYSNSLDGPFVYDDFGDIETNPAIRELWPLWRPIVNEVEGRIRVHSRPVVVLSFAANYALGGLATRGFHVTNVAIHLLAGLTLLGIVRRTLSLPRQRRYSAAATPLALALAVALLWVLHPLQTQAVTYIVQRYESLMGLFYLLTLYAALRCATAAGPSARAWGAASVVACLLALGCKEVAISAPLVVLLFDRAFINGSFREAWRHRWPLYVGLAATWIVFIPFFLSFSGGSGLVAGQGGWAGFSESKPSLPYAMNQPQVILHYLRLAVWPQGQCLDYAWVATDDLSQLWPSLLVLGMLLALTVGLLIWRPRCGFLGAWFFMILAPTSSVIPINDLAFEHRMYLPLAAVVAIAVFATFELQSRLRATAIATAGAAWTGLIVVAVLTLGTLTFLRNQVYADALTLWSDVAAKRPGNGRAHGNLGLLYSRRGQPQLAVEQFQETQRLVPFVARDPILQRDWASCLTKLKQYGLAVPHFLRSVATDPNDADTHLKLARVLAVLGYRTAALSELEAALRLDPELRAEPSPAEDESNFATNARRRVFAQSVAAELGTDCDRAGEHPADPCRVEYELGAALLAVREYDAALERFAAAEKMHPDETLSWDLRQARQTALQEAAAGDLWRQPSIGSPTPPVPGNDHR